ncbi:family 2 encapsulin nanocompartment cargo protein polyprenyl transferase [Phytohabitans sp. LJ34]|uniref:family 2 encapsulin nanocompartment cargo protein polyprenyl transferase n=1 Tax=Phytohabitans sp. LJ34 TaxID=3452217 RepID=UPI003F8B25B0
MTTVSEKETSSGRSAPEVLAWSRTCVDPALRAAVDTLPETLRQIAGYHFGWWDRDGRAVGAPGGKAIRPALVLLSAEAVGGDPTAALPAAVAVELVHNFSLLHDDVMDGDRTRRHRDTAWTVYGVGPAILAGDALLALAFDVLASSGHPAVMPASRLLHGAVQDLLDGQSADLAFEMRSEVELRECLGMARGKTGALLGCACALGATLGGAGWERVDRFREFGERLGLAFQFVDDLLGIWGDPAVTGKPVHADLRQRKKSLPVVAALTSGTPAGRELAVLYSGAPPSGADLVRAAELVAEAGGRDWSQAQADDLLGQALHHLRQAHPAAAPAAELTGLAGLVTHRDR